MKKVMAVFFIVSTILFLTGCMEHIDLPAPISPILSPISTPIPQETQPSNISYGNLLYGTDSSVSYGEILDTVSEGIKTFGGNPTLYGDVVAQCLFEQEERGDNELLLTRIDDAPSFYIEPTQEYNDRYREIVNKIINNVMTRAYTEAFKPFFTDNRENATFIISFISEDSYIGNLLSLQGIYGLYITGDEEKGVIKNGFIYVRDYNFLKNTHLSFSDSDIWKMEEAILSEEMNQAPINCQDNTIDSTMRFYDSPKINDYLKNPDLTQKDFEVIKIALKLPVGVDKDQWVRFMNEFINK